MAQIIPAIISKTPTDIMLKIHAAEQFTGCRNIQIDIMDGIFVKNKTVSAKALLNLNTSLNYELHLMVQSPEKKLDGFLKTNAKRIAVHYESTKRLCEIIEKIHGCHKKVLLAINPITEVSVLLPYIKKLDGVLLMSVNPGFYGSMFNTKTYQRVKKIRDLSPSLPISIDGGISVQNIQRLLMAGATQFIVGSRIFQADDPEKAYSKFRKALRGKK